MATQDWLTSLLRIVPVTGRVEHRCLFGAPWRLDNAAAGAGEIPYHIVLEGSAVLEDEHGRIIQSLGPGDIAILSHGSRHVLHDGSGREGGPIHSSRVHSFNVDENTGPGEHLDMLCGSFLLSPAHERLVRSYFPQEFVISSEPAPGGRPSGLQTNLIGVVRLMREETSLPDLGSEAFLNALSTALFALALRQAASSQSAPTGLLALAANPRLAPALSALLEAPDHPWTLPELADRCHLSRATFIRQFQAALGRSASDMLTDIRMTVAANVLRETDSSTAAVAEAAGYQSEAAFQRAFKARMGVTPAQYRREARQRLISAQVGRL